MGKTKIMIVEDEVIVAEAIKSSLESMNYEVASMVTTGEAAVDDAEQRRPAVILMDIRLSGQMDGIEAADLIRTRFDIPVIFLTAYADEDKLERAKLSLPFGYLLKPFQDKDLKVTIEMALYTARVDAERKKAQETVKRSEKDLRIRNQINSIFLTFPDENMYAEVLEVILEFMESEYGTFGYFNENGYFLVPGMTRKIYWGKCNVPEKDIIFGKGEFGGIWGRAVKEKKTLIANEGPFNTPKGHVLIKNTMVAPIIFHDEVISAIHLANKRTGYSENDRAMLDTIVNQIAPVLYARLQRDKQDKERKKAEEALQFTQFAIDRSSDAAFWMDPDARFIYVNDAACRALGYSREELLTKTVQDIDPEFPAEAWPEQWADLQHRGSFILETLHRRKDGTDFPVEISVNFIKFGDREFNCAFARDITERRKMEEIQLKSEKLESLGTLAGGIAHDFNNLLSIIMVNLSMAEEDIKSRTGSLKFLKAAEEASNRAKDLTARLITFSKGGEPFKRVVSIEDLLKDFVSASLSGSDMDCKFSIPDDLSAVNIDQGQMKQAIHNIVINAHEAMAGEGTIKVDCENVTIGENDVLTLKSGKYVKISITDQGTGIPEENLAKIFDPYFSTKEMGEEKGMGLGLSSCHSIVENHNGLITVESEFGVGTILSIYLPASDKEIAEPEPVRKPIPEKPVTVKGKVLLMDDEKMIRDYALPILSQLGYDAEVCSDGAEAIEQYKKAMESDEPFDAVILDLTNQPGMGGKEAVKKLLEIDPDVKGIVSTGYSKDMVVDRFREYGFSGVLIKPYTVGELGKVLSEVLLG